MQHFNASDFVALSPAKAKAQALAMFCAAQVEPAGDWQGVAYALHSVITRKRGKAASQDDIAMQDSADAGEFAPWLDYDAKGKSTLILRGRVTVTFADGWSRTVGLLQAKGKGWSIGKAVIFAVACYQSAAARRMVGNDNILYSGEHFLPGLIAVPDITSIESADSDETVAGDLVWNPDAANAATRDMRAGQVDPATYQRGEVGEDCALSRARFEIGRAMGLMRTPQEIEIAKYNRHAVERVGALLFPWDRGRCLDRVAFMESAFTEAMDADPEGFPVPVELDQVDADPRADLAPADHETMLAATEIVKPPSYVLDLSQGDFARSLAAVSYLNRLLLVEDALIAWPALVEPYTAVDGETLIPGGAGDDAETAETPMPQAVAGGAGEADIMEAPAEAPMVESHDSEPEPDAPACAPDAAGAEAARHHNSAPPAADPETAHEAQRDQVEVPPAAVEAVAEPAPRVKPRYRFSSITGLYEIVPADAG